MIPPLRRSLPVLALLASSSVWAWVWDDRPTKLFEKPSGLTQLSQSLRPTLQAGGRPAHGRAASPPAPRAPRLSGAIHAVHAVSLDGQETELPTPAGLDLSDALPVDAEAVELLIELDGPVWVEIPFKNSGRFFTELHPDTIRVVLEDPEAAAEAGQVRLALDAGWEGALDDALLAVAE